MEIFRREQLDLIFLVLSNYKVLEITIIFQKPKLVNLLLSFLSLLEYGVEVFVNLHPDVMLDPFDELMVLNFLLQHPLIHLFNIDIFLGAVWLIVEYCFDDHLKKCFFVIFFYF